MLWLIFFNNPSRGETVDSVRTGVTDAVGNATKPAKEHDEGTVPKGKSAKASGNHAPQFSISTNRADPVEPARFA